LRTWHRTIALSILLVLATFVTAGAQSNTSLSVEAKAYLEQALDIMQQQALRKRSIDWSAVRKSTLEQAAGAQTPIDTYEALRFALRQVNPHSFLQLSPEQTKQEAARKTVRQAPAVQGTQPPTEPRGKVERPPSPFRERRQPEGHIHKLGDRTAARVVVPSFVADDAGQFATKLQRIVAEMDAAHACGWVIDLRGNGGGNMWPMLVGIGPVLGEGEVGAFLDAEGVKSTWRYRDGKSSIRSADGSEEVTAKVEGTPYRLTATPPVAVLIDRGTASSGEIIAIAFRGRTLTRFFGEDTMGFSTVNKGFALPDGANIVLTTGVSMDRTGAEYGGAIAPDERIPIGESQVPTNDDPTVRAALKWLSTQPRCETKHLKGGLEKRGAVVAVRLNRFR
jgi:carboxyl-terminal processing protease